MDSSLTYGERGGGHLPARGRPRRRLRAEKSADGGRRADGRVLPSPDRAGAWRPTVTAEALRTARPAAAADPPAASAHGLAAAVLSPAKRPPLWPAGGPAAALAKSPFRDGPRRGRLLPLYRRRAPPR